MQDPKKEKEIDTESEQLRNFPEEMGIADPEGFKNYSNIKRNLDDRDTMFNIWDLFSKRLFPVLCLTYVASVLGISINHGSHFLFDKSAYILAFTVMLWVSLAPMLSITIKSMEGFRGDPIIWYWWLAGSQIACGIIFHILFPNGLSGVFEPLQLLLVASLPMHAVIYFFCIKNMLPEYTAKPLVITGVICMIYGLVFA